jgi:hypothetical protein
MELDSNLKFRRKRLIKAAKEIQKIAKKSNLFDTNPRESDLDELWEDINKTPAPGKKDKDIAVALHLTPIKPYHIILNKTLGKDRETDTKWIGYYWSRQWDSETHELVDIYNLYVRGRKLCDDYLFGLHGYKDYESCPCPEKFKTFCKKTQDVLKKYSFDY